MILQVLLALFVVLVFRCIFQRLLSGRVPPGPPSIPIVGCLPFVRPSMKLFTCDKMADKYGDLVRFDIGTETYYM